VLGLSRAQAQSAEAAAIGLHINGLTSAERDALAQDLDTQGELHVSFACVPAGILVLEGTGRTVSTPERRQAALHAVRQRIAAARISEEQLTLSTAEALCAEARNH
jgi:hypothetical protein